MSQSLEIGIGLKQYLSEELIGLAHLCEDLGFDHIWYGNDKFLPDMVVGLTLLASHTENAKICTYIFDPYTLHPALTATVTATLDEASKGRTVLCLAAGGSRFLEMGKKRHKPAVALEESVHIIRQMLAGDQVTLHGQVAYIDNGFLGFQARPDIPIFIGSRGDRILQLSGRVADGVLIGTYASREGIEHGINMVKKGLEQSGRSIRDIKIYSRVDCCVLDDSEAARDAMRSMISVMLMASYPDQGFVKRLGLRIPDKLFQAIEEQREEKVVRLSHLVPDSFVDSYSWAGNAEEVSEAINDAIKAGIDGIVVHFHTPSDVPIDQAIRNFTEKVTPRITSCQNAERTT